MCLDPSAVHSRVLIKEVLIVRYSSCLKLLQVHCNKAFLLEFVTVEEQPNPKNLKDWGRHAVMKQSFQVKKHFKATKHGLL